MSDLVSCSRCGKLHPRGYKCNVGRIRKNIQEVDKLRSTWDWRLKADQIKEDAEGLCEVCRAEGTYTYKYLEVHHITKLREAPEKLLDDDNLICLCVYHHKLADAGKIEKSYLQDLAEKRCKKCQRGVST